MDIEQRPDSEMTPFVLHNISDGTVGGRMLIYCTAP